MTIQELEQFIQAYGKSIYTFCRRLCRDSEAADELYQDVWLAVMQQLDRIQAENNVKSYLLSVALGIWQNKKRKAAWRHRIAPQKELTEETGSTAKADDTLTSLLAKEEKTMVFAAVDRLRDIYRIPILLYYMEELPVKEIASLLHVPEGTIKRRLWTAKRQLKKELEEYLYE